MLDPSAGASLVYISRDAGLRCFPLRPGATMTIGRRPTCDIVLADPQVSAIHAQVFPVGNRWRIRDLGSRNGTRVNGERIVEHDLRPEDRIVIGESISLVFEWGTLGTPEGSGDATPASSLPAGLPDRPAPPRPPYLRIPRAEIEDAIRRRLPARDAGLGRERITLLHQLAEALGRSGDERALLDRALELTLALLPADRGFVFVRTAEPSPSADLALAAMRSRPDFDDDFGAGVSTTILREALHSGTAVATSDAADDDRFAGAASVRRGLVHGVMAAPLMAGGRTLGVIYLCGAPPGAPFTRSELELLSAIGFHAGLALENSRLVRDLESRVADRTREIERLSRERAAILSMAAHDLRTPLTGILGYLDLILARAEEDAASTWLAGEVSVVIDAGRHMMELLTDLLDHQRAEAGRLALDLERLDLARFLGNAVRVYERWAAGAERRVDLALAPALPEIMADPRRLTQILNNLVHNAIKYTPRGGCVRIEAQPAADEPTAAVEIVVADEGRGFASTDTARMLLAFERGTSVEPPVGEGHGLGLAIVSKLVEIHEGRLSLLGEPGRGGRVTVLLPVHGPRAATATPDTVREPPRALEETRSIDREKINAALRAAEAKRAAAASPDPGR